MGNSLATPSPGDVRILMLGLDGAGKTSILYKVKNGDMGNASPTSGFNFETVEYKHMRFGVWDISGSPSNRKLWPNFFQNTQALIFVVDSACGERLQEAKSELQDLLAHEELKDAPLLVYLNRMDTNTAVSVAVVEEFLGDKGHKYLVQPCSADNGEGLIEGLE